MDVVFTPSVILIIFLAIGLAGFVTGVTGFGFAVIGTGLLASVLPSQTAIILMLFPMFAATGSLANELDRESFTESLNRFWLFFLAILVGTILGMVALDSVPTQPLTLVLGVFVLLYVAFLQNVIPAPGRSYLLSLFSAPGTVGETAFGFVSGLVFGATNVGVQVVAYVQSLRLDHPTFVGVLAMIFVGLTGIRIGLAAWLGFYVDPPLVLVSLGAVLPSLLAVKLGQMVRPRISERQIHLGIVSLLTVIGIRLVLAGSGIA